MTIDTTIIALLAIGLAFMAGFGFGWLYRNQDYAKLLDEYQTLIDRDEKGRFKKSMRVLKNG